MRRIIFTGLFLFMINLLHAQEGLVYDIDSNAYNVVNIGGSVWLKENLRVTRYNNGDPIGTCGNIYLDEDKKFKYQWAYDNNEANVPVYGRLYTWFAVMDERKLCPAGWRVPTEEEWRSIQTSLKKDVALKMMETGNKHWLAGGVKANNSTGFTGLPGGQRYHISNFDEMTIRGNWWTSNDLNKEFAPNISMVYTNSSLVFRAFEKNTGLSVRCMKD